MKRGARLQGFTLVEVVIVITIITILTYLVVTALPITRTNQQLESDMQQIRSLVSEAQQQALNEVRSEECVALVGSDEIEQRRCSDIGVVVMNQAAVMFADIDGDRGYTVGEDFIIEELSLSADVEDGEAVSVLFEASPPTIITYGNNQVIGANQTLPLTLVLEDASRRLTVGPYGVIEYEE